MSKQVQSKDIPVIESAKNGYWAIYDNRKKVWHKTKYLRKINSINEESINFPDQDEINTINQEIDTSLQNKNMQIKNPSEYVVPKIDIQDGEYLILKDEGEYRTLPQDSSKEVLTFRVQLPSGNIKKMSMNATSQREMLLAWGDDSSNWVNKKCLVEIVRQKVFDKTKDVMYLHPGNEKASSIPEEIIDNEEEELLEELDSKSSQSSKK